MPFLPGTGSAIAVDVIVNGEGPWPFLVDTGSSHSAIDAALARRLGAPRVAKTLVSTSSGKEWAAVVRLTRVAVGPLAAVDLLATALPSGRLDDTGRLAGVLGWDVLASSAFTLDYAHRVMTWAPQTHSVLATLRLEERHGIRLICAKAGRDVLRLMPDSGSDVTVLFDRGTLPRVDPRPGLVGIRSIAGARPGRAGALRQLTLGTLQLSNHPVVVVNGSDIGDEHGDGLLSLHLFDSVTFRPREGVLELRRDTGSDEHTSVVQ
jgi:hypothetical protein